MHNNVSNNILENTQINNSSNDSQNNESQNNELQKEVALPTPEELGLDQDQLNELDLYANQQSQESIENKNLNYSSEEKTSADQENLKSEESNKDKTLHRKVRYSQEELKAMKNGWKPKDKFKGDSNDWRTAKEYNLTHDILEKLSKTSKNNKKLHQNIDHLTTIVKKQMEQLNQKENDSLIAERQTAIENGDVEGVNHLDKRLNEVKQNQIEIQQNVEPDNSTDLIDFAEQNRDWFNHQTEENSEMHQTAVDYDNFLFKNEPYLNVKQRLQLVKEKITHLYAHRFENDDSEINKKNTSQPRRKSKSSIQDHQPNFGSVEKKNYLNISQKKGYTFDDLPSDVKIIAKNLYYASKKQISLDEYANELFRIGAIEYEQ